MLLATDNPLNAEIAQAVRKMFIIDVNVVHDGEECIHPELPKKFALKHRHG